MRHLTKAVFCEGNLPALAVEVASPGNATRDTRDKRTEYALAKVLEYWIVNPVDSYVTVLVLDVNTSSYHEIGEYSGSELIKSVLFPDIKITAEAILNSD